MDIYFVGNINSSFGRRKGSKDKKKRVINNSPSADGQVPLNKAGQQQTGYKYYRKRRALGFIGTGTALGAGLGYSLGGAMAIGVSKNPSLIKKAALVGTVIGAGAIGGSSLLEHAGNKHSPFYQKKLI